MQNNFSKCREWVPRGTSQHKWRWLTTLLLILTLGIGQMWGEVVGKNTSTTGTIIYSNINSTGSGVNLTAGTEENGFNAISGASFKSGPGVISVAENGYFALCVDDITEGTVYHTMTVTSNVPDWTSTSGGSNGRYAQLYIGDTGAKKYLYTKYSTNTTVEEATGLTKEGSNVRGIYSFSFTSSDLTTIGTKKYLKFKALGGEYKPAGFKIVASTTPAVDTQAPTLSSSVPANNATDVAVEGTIVLTFSEDIADIDDTKFSLSGATIGTIAIDGTDPTKVNVAYSEAANSETVTLSVAKDAVADAAGNKSAALDDISFTTVASSGGGDPTPTCKGTLFAWLPKTGLSDADIAAGTYDLPGSWLTSVSGGTAQMYVPSNGNMRIRGSQLAYNSSNAYIHVVMDCDLADGDIIDINSSGNKNKIWLSLTSTRPSSASNAAAEITQGTSFVLSSTKGSSLIGKNEFYIWRNSSTTQIGQLTISRPYSVSYDNLKEATHTMPAKAIEFTLQELTHASFDHTGWTADKLVKVGGVDKAAGTTLGKTDVVTLTDNTAFTAVWEAKVTKHTVTYYDGEAIEANKLGSELIKEGSNPTGAGLAPKKQGFTFGGWSLTNGGAAISAYTDVTVNEDKNLFAVWTAVDCPTKGTVFSFVMNNDAKPGSEVKAPVKDTLIVNKYLTISGSGDVVIGNTTNNNNQYASVRTEPDIKLSGTTAYVRLALDCQLAEGDVITIAKNGTQIIISDEIGSSGPTGHKYTTANNSENTIVVGANETTAEWVGSRDLYFWYKGGGVNITAISVNRPYTVSFNMNGQSATAIADQKIVAGGKVSEPTAPSVTGQEFGGWFKVAACTAGNEWDFATDVVNDDVELFAKWTALPKMTLDAGTGSGDEVVSYPAVNSAVAVPECPAGFEKTGYIFAGWTYSPSVTVENGQFTMPNEDLTLTAQWVDASSVARIGSNYYATLAEALAHAAEGEIVLLQDIDVDAQVEIADGVSATIDLAGHKIEYTSATTLPSGVILVHNGGSLTINDSSDPDAGSIVSGDNAYAAIALTKAGDNAANPAVLVINGGTLTGYYYGITGNGSRPNTQITINGGAINATATNDNLGIYHPQNGTLTVTGGTITGYASAIEMRAGTLVIEGGTFTATATEFSCNPNGSGTTTVGAAIAIAQHTTKKDIEVTINGGTFTGVKALNESNPQANDPAPQVTMAVTAGTFTGEVSTVDVDKFVSGGSFSEPVAEANCATGYVPETKANGKYGVIVPAQSIDFMAIIDAKGTGDAGKAELDGQLASKHYDIEGTLNDDRLEAGGFKVKKTGLTISFSVEKEKVVEITTGHISGASIKVDDAAAVAMEGDKKHTYYSDDAQAFLITMTATGNAYNIFKSINIRDPYVVTFNANGGEDVASLNGTPSVTLPSASKGTDSFVGWFDGETKIGEAGESYTPTANITLVAHWEAVSTDARLSAIEFSAVGTLSPAFDPDVVNYTYTMPYGTADVPTITGATAANAKAQEPVIDAQAAAWGETAHVHGVAQSGATKDYYVQMLRAPKDGICIIKSTPTSGTEADVDGIYQGSAYFKGKAANKKLNSTYDYVAVELADGYTFQAGDKVVLNQAADLGDASDITKFYVFTEVPADGKTYVTVDNAAPVKGDNWFDMPADLVGASALYIGRIDAKCNPTVGYLAVYRPLPPVLNKVTVAGVEGKPNALKEVVFEVAASTSQSQLEAIAFDWISNNDAWTVAHTPVATNTWEFGVANTVTLTDKDGDQSVYTITVNKAIPASNVELATLTVDGNAITLVPGQAVYSYEYPYGTAEDPAPVVAATAEDANAEVGTITQAASKNGTATFTVTAEDGTTYRDYTINISVSRIPAVAIYDGSTMTNITTKTGSDPTGLSWSMGSNVAATGDNIAGTWQGKNYTHAVKGFKANANENNIVSFVVPENYMAKVRLVGSTNSSGSERKMFIAKEATNDASKAIENYVITSSTYDAQGFVTDFMLPGTYYLGSTDSYRLFEFSVQLYPIDYSRDVTEGKYGTICLPNGGVMVGASIYTLAYYGETSKKIFFDEVVDGTMEAGKPYLFLPNEGIDRIGVFYTDAANEPNKTVNGFVGYIGASEDPNDALQVPAGEGNYIVQNNQYREILTGATAYILSHRAYIHFEGINTSEPAKAPGARRIGISGAPQVVTGADNLNVGDQPVKLIIDGQMYILRGEKMYDATGRLVK